MKQKYKKTEIGVIPEDWEITTLEKEYELFAGGDLNTDDYSDVKTSKYQYAILSNGLQNNGVYGFCSRPKYCGNAVTITGRGDIGHCVYRENAFSAIIRLLVCQPRKQINSKFISEYLESTKPFVFESTGVPQLTVPQIKNTLIPLPPFAEQNRIAEALSDIDELISSLEKLIAKKKAIKQGAMKQLLTGKTRLSGFSGKWNYEIMGKYVDFQVGFPFSSSYFNDHNGSRLIRNRDLKSDDQIIFTSEKCPMDFIVNNNDILIGMDGDFIPCVWRKGRALLNQRVGKLICHKNMVNKFAYYAFQKPLLELQGGTGATTVKHLSHEDIKSLVVYMPPTIEEQDAIANILTSIDNEIMKLENKYDKAQLIKQGMMQLLLTGQIRLM